MRELTLNGVPGLADLFQRELAEVITNIKDPNTAAGAKRSISMKVTFSPKADREGCEMSIDVRSTLCPAVPHTTLVYVGMKDGQPVAYGNDPRQKDMFDKTADADPDGVHNIDDHRRDGTEG